MKTILSMPTGMEEVPVPFGIIMDPLEAKLDRFTRACLTAYHAPRCTLVQVEKAWNEFSDDEQRLLRLEWLFWLWWLLGLLKLVRPAWVASTREGLVFRMTQRSTSIRLDLMRGRIKRPPHTNPRTMLVRN